jgi:hypothetical protein
MPTVNYKWLCVHANNTKCIRTISKPKGIDETNVCFLFSIPVPLGMVYACNPSYSKSEDWRIVNLRPVWEKGSETLSQ